MRALQDNQDSGQTRPEETVFTCGGKRSERKLMYHKIPLVGLKRLAERYTLGSKYEIPGEPMKLGGRRNWKEGDEEYFTDALNHAIEHLARFADGDRTDDHLAAAAWGCFALMWAQDRGIIQ